MTNLSDGRVPHTHWRKVHLTCFADNMWSPRFVFIGHLHFKINMIISSDKIIDRFSVLSCRKLATRMTEEIRIYFGCFIPTASKQTGPFYSFQRCCSDQQLLNIGDLSVPCCTYIGVYVSTSGGQTLGETMLQFAPISRLFLQLLAPRSSYYS